MTTQVKIPVYFLRAVADKRTQLLLGRGELRYSTLEQAKKIQCTLSICLYKVRSTVGVNGTRGDDNALSNLVANRSQIQFYRNLRTPYHTVYTKTKFPGISRLRFQ